jgi:hypothetical protein
MPAPPRKRPLGPEQRRVLLLLAGIPFGATDAAISANGITRKTLARLIRAGLVTTEREVKARGQTIGRVRITEAVDGHLRLILSAAVVPLPEGTPPLQAVLAMGVGYPLVPRAAPVPLAMPFYRGPGFCQPG